MDNLATPLTLLSPFVLPSPCVEYRFVAESVFSKEDSTVFLHDTAAPSSQLHDPSSPFLALKETLLKAASGTEERPYSLVQELVFAHMRPEYGGHGVFKARGVACFCERGRTISITLRSIDKYAATQLAEFKRDDEALSLKEYLPKSERSGEAKKGLPKSEFEASTEPKGNWFSVREHCEALHNLVFDQEDRPHGLVVICGSTNSAKSLIARGLIHELLFRRVAAYKEKKKEHDASERGKAFEVEYAKYAKKVKEYDIKTNGLRPKLDANDDWRERRPHLVTFEDPIEKFLFEPRNDRTATQIALEFGIDYTPREKAKDVGTLEQGFADALRQTPYVYYIGEVRDIRDWKAVLEFAGTGHLVVTTAHSGSLLEMMTKIFSAVDATTQAQRRLYAEKIRAIVHMRSFGASPVEQAKSYRSYLADSEFHGISPPIRPGLLLPCVWRKREKGLAALTGTGFGSIVPHGSIHGRDEESCFGYHALLTRLLENRAMAGMLPGGFGDLATDREIHRDLAELARSDDL